ncbi:outer membrane protein assembly factor BamE [Psychrobacter sp. ASPA161_6]|uniref:outer membrane protein assembly factor BamE n=1 Tax=Psychrobacter sp. ASPA161_6 TaxID=3160962 RepID=UPI003F7FDDC6
MKIIFKTLVLSNILILSACSNLSAFDTHNADATAFPVMSQSYLKSLPYYDINQVKLIQIGQHKDQVRQILGNPHFRTNVLGPKIWNYNIGLQLGGNVAYNNCQLRVNFDKNNYVESFMWKDKQCADQVHAALM